MNRPKCLWCGKQLGKRTYLYYKQSDENDPVVLRNMQVLGITKRKPAFYGTTQEGEFLYVWCGEYGSLGDGYFCRSGCGWNWAVDRLEKDEGHP